jgi:hypothetical protein
MIPHRMSNSEVAVSGLRDRVTACRKRLRENRVMVKVHANAGAEDLFSETPTAAVAANRILEFGEQTEEQEVGIT